MAAVSFLVLLLACTGCAYSYSYSYSCPGLHTRAHMTQHPQRCKQRAPMAAFGHKGGLRLGPRLHTAEDLGGTRLLMSGEDLGEAEEQRRDPSRNPIKRLWILALARIAAVKRRLGLGLGMPSSLSRPLEMLIKLLRMTVFNRQWYNKRTLMGLVIAVITAHRVMSRSAADAAAKATEVPFSAFISLLKDPSALQQIRVSPDVVEFAWEGRRAFTRLVKAPPGVMQYLIDAGVEFRAMSRPPSFVGIIAQLFSLVWMYLLFRSMRPDADAQGNRKPLDRGQIDTSVSFADVAGQELAKSEVEEVVEMLRNPKKFTRVGARLPSGVLLVGPPGTGKTLLARVMAAEAKAPFFACSATDFVELFVGRGPARIRKLFKRAQQLQPCIVFIDEVDALGRRRGRMNSNSEEENTLNALLSAMDGLDTSNNGVIVVAATNRYEVLDPALLRPGRFDRIVRMSLPDRIGREEILRVHSKRLRLDDNVDLDLLARLTPGLSGADLSFIVNEAAIRTARRAGERITTDDFMESLKAYYRGRGGAIPFWLQPWVPPILLPS